MSYLPGCLDPLDGEAGRLLRGTGLVQVAGQRDDRGAGRARQRVQVPAAGPRADTFVWIDALPQKVLEGGRLINLHCLSAIGVKC